MKVISPELILFHACIKLTNQAARIPAPAILYGLHHVNQQLSESILYVHNIPEKNIRKTSERIGEISSDKNHEHCLLANFREILGGFRMIRGNFSRDLK